MTTKAYRWLAGCICVAVALVSGSVSSQTSSDDPPDNHIGGNDSPAGVSSGFNGMVNSACAYDPYTGNARRVVDDIVVPGTLGVYPLKWTRYYNSRDADIGNPLGLTWRHSYMWSEDYYGGNIIRFPDGREIDFNEASGLAERMPEVGRLVLGDGGQVIFDPTTYTLPNGQYVRYRVARIIDPHGLTTTISYDTIGTDDNGNDIYRISRITEPGGRYLLLNYSEADGTTITGVQALTADNNVTQSVTYTYSNTAAVGGVYMTLSAVTYGDGTVGKYTYQNDNSGRNGAPKIPLLQTCDDVRYSGPMHQIQYLFVTGDRIRGKIKSELKPGSGEAVSTLTFPANRAQTRVETRGDGPKRTFSYNAAGRLLSYTDFKNSASTATRLTYDSGGFVGTVTKPGTDAGSKRTTYGNEPNIGQVTQIIHPDGYHIDLGYTDANNPYYLWWKSDERAAYAGDPQHTIRYDRDPVTHRVTQITYPDGATESFWYTDLGQVRTHQRRNGAYEHFAYNARRRLATVWNPTTNGNYPPAADVPYVGIHYYESGPWADRVSEVIDQLGRATLYDYDRDAASQPAAGRGLVTRITHVDGTYISFAYDQFGNVIAEENELRQRTSYAYDDYNRVVTVTPPAPAGTTTLTYEKAGQTDSYLHTARAPHLAADGAGVTVEAVYDENFRRASVTQLDGTDTPPTTSFQYWPAGLLRLMRDPRGDEWTYRYTDRNELLSTTNPLGETTSQHYDPAGNVDYINRRDNRRVDQSYDQMNRLQNIVEPATDSHNKTTTFTYWPSGKVRTIQDDDAQITTFEYDASDLKTRMVYPDQSSYQQWGYNEAHVLTSRRTVGGNVQRFFYDARYRMVSMGWEGNTIPEYSQFGYDAASNLTLANNQSVNISRQYDGAGRLSSETVDAFGAVGAKTVTYAFDGAGKRTAMGIKGTDYQFAYHYDTLGRLDQLLNVQNAGTSPSASLWYQYSYDAASNQTQRFCAINGVAQKYGRDDLGRIADLTVENIAAPKYPGTPQPGGGGAPLLTIVPTLIDALVTNALATVDENVPEIGTIISQERYSYDAMSRVTDVQRSGAAASGNDHFSYDYSGQTAAASYTNWYGSGTRSVSYDQDTLGNRIQVNDSGNPQSYSRNGSYLNQYVSGPAGPVGNNNDHEVVGYAGFNYTYLDGKLASITGGGNAYGAKYDAFGRCISRYVNGRTTYYTYDGPHPVYEWNGDGTVAGWNLYGQGIDEILLRGDYVIVSSGQGYFFQQNRAGSVTHLTSFAGNPIEKYRYDAFGAPTTLDPILGYFNNRFKFTGREYQEAFGIYDYRSRAYHPGLGRFLSEDPLGFDAGDTNMFRYCGGDPVNQTDPFGLWTFQLGLQLSGQIGVMSFAWGVGIAFDGHGNVGGYTSSYVGGSGAGADIALGAGGMNSNADTIYGLEGPFVEASVTAGEEGAATVGTFISPDGTVSGSSVFGGVGGGLGATGGISTTSVAGWFNIADLFGSSAAPTGAPPPGGTTFVDPNDCKAPDCVTMERITVTGQAVPGPTMIFPGTTYYGPGGNSFHLGTTGNIINGPAFTVTNWFPGLTSSGGGDWQNVMYFPSGGQPGEGTHPVSFELY